MDFHNWDFAARISVAGDLLRGRCGSGGISSAWDSAFAIWDSMPRGSATWILYDLDIIWPGILWPWKPINS